MSLSFCNFEDTGKIFRDKKIYKCSYCGSQLALEDPTINIICFKKHNEVMTQIENDILPKQHKVLNLHAESEAQFKALVSQQVDLERQPIPDMQNMPTLTEPSDIMCSKEQIDERLDICHKCEHFKDSSCLLCGCVVVRDKNFNNKLAHKRHSCPINKWGPIIDVVS
jgi:hypothetical protein